MASLRTLWSKLCGLWKRNRFEQDLDAEIQQHLALAESRFIEQGMTSSEARAAARRAFGGVDRLKEANRDQYSFALLDNMRRDFRFAARNLVRNPGFTLAAVVTLGLGIGANTAIFSVLNGVLLQPLPYANDQSLVLLRQQLPDARIHRLNFSVHDIDDYRARTRTLSSLVEYHEMSFVLLGGEEAETVQTGVVSWNFFDVLGVKPQRGRTFQPSDEQHNADAVLVLSYDYWQRAFRGDPTVVGRVLRMNDKPHTVVGVLPPVPQFPQENDVYMPTTACPFRSAPNFIANRNARMMGVLARLKPDVSLQAAQADVNIVASQLREEFPESYAKSGGYRGLVVSLKEQLTNPIRPTLWVLLSTAAFVLLIVCASVANLLLARMLRRSGEISVRTALGASRTQLLRQFLTESLLLSVTGGGVGLAVAFASLDLLVAFAAKFTTRAAEIHMDGWVLLFATAVSLLTGLIFGCVPALTPVRDVNASLRASGRNTSGSSFSGMHRRFRTALMVVQVAAAFVLLIGAGLMTRTLLKLQQVDLGLRGENILTAQVSLNFTHYRDPQAAGRFYRDVLERVRTIATVTQAAAGSTFPLNAQTPFPTRFRLKDRSVEDARALPQADALTASPDYFNVLGIPLLAGRVFSDSDRAGTQPVIVVNRSMARRYWGEGNAVGHEISTNDGRTWLSIVGVVADSRKTLDADVEDTFYYAFDQVPGTAAILLRTTGNPSSVAPLLRAAVHSVDPEQPVDGLRTLDEVRSQSIASPRLTVALLSVFATMALVITATGIAGVIGFFVAQRRNEFGIRIALGASRGTVLWLAMREGLGLITAGILVGLAGAFGLSRLISGLLFGVAPTDPVTFAVVTFIVMGAGASACFMPAFRAASIDPNVALRND